MFVLWLRKDQVRAVFFAPKEYQKLTTVLTGLGKSVCLLFFIIHFNHIIIIIIIIITIITVCVYKGCYSSRQCELESLELDHECSNSSSTIRCDENGFITHL